MKEKWSNRKNTLNELAKHIKGYKKDIALTWVFVFLEVGLEIAIAALISFLLECIQGVNNNGNPDFPGIILWSSVIIVMAVVAAVMGILAGYWASSAACGFGKNLRVARPPEPLVALRTIAGYIEKVSFLPPKRVFYKFIESAVGRVYKPAPRHFGIYRFRREILQFQFYIR